MKIFESARIGNLVLKNRIIRSATYEGMCTDGFPTDKYKNLYIDLAKSGVGCIITGFAYIASNGKAMQPNQTGIDSSERIPSFKNITDEVHNYDCKIIMQIFHPGRQTIKEANQGKVYGVSNIKSHYFNSNPEVLTKEQILSIADKFAEAASYAKQAGFDGVQVHAAHGYLIHQFLLSAINNRKDEFGIDPATGIGTKFLDIVIDKIRDKCGPDYPVLVKVSGSDDYKKAFNEAQFIEFVKFLDKKKVSGIEVSYGTMDYPLNIIRGKSIPVDLILRINPRYKIKNKMVRAMFKKLMAPFMLKQFKSYSPMYNLPFAKIAKQNTDIPVICVGGFRKGEDISSVVEQGTVDFVSLCRPFICEPDFAAKLEKDKAYISKCIDCNICSIMTDSGNGTRCYKGNSNIQGG